jgi:hypothetical protein
MFSKRGIFLQYVVSFNLYAIKNDQTYTFTSPTLLSSFVSVSAILLHSENIQLESETKHLPSISNHGWCLKWQDVRVLRSKKHRVINWAKRRLRPTPADCASGRVYAKKGSESYYSAFQQATYLPPQNTSSPKRRAFSRVLSHPPIFSCSLQLATRGMAHGGRGKLTGRMKQKDMDTRSLLEDGPRIAMGLTYGACVMHVRSHAIAGVGLRIRI